MNNQVTMAQILYELNDSCHKMPDIIFGLKNANKPETKCFYNLIADCFLDIQGYSVLMSNSCWSQAGAVLRIAIEQICIFIVLIENPQLINEYIRVFQEKAKYMIESKSYQKKFEKEKNLTNINSINKYFDYGWFSLNGDYNRKLIIETAGLKEINYDIDHFLNKFAHGSLSIFQFNGGEKPWDNMRQEGKRMNNIMIVLFQQLYCEFRIFLGNENTIELPVDLVYFKTFHLKDF